MIHFKTSGDIFEEDVEALVNPVNCVGVMGAGLALAFKKKYPDNFYAYRKMCPDTMVPGNLFLYRESDDSNPKYIINFPTKDHWSDPSRLEYITSGLKSLRNVVKTRNLLSIAMPALGCGLGGLEWDTVRELIIATMNIEGVIVTVFEPR